jgi:predicted  nucleic acid-binding Zn-ribbon protein
MMALWRNPMARRQNGNGKLDKLDEAMTALVQNQSALQQTTASLQQTMATFLQNHALFEQRFIELRDRMDHKFAEIDRRLEHIEAFLVKMAAELPEKIFGFAQAQMKPNGFITPHPSFARS